MSRTHRASLSYLACAGLMTLGLQVSACSFNTADAPEDAASRTDTSIHQSAARHHHPMTYLASTVATAVYLPAKVVFAVGGGAVSAVSYVLTFGNAYPASRIWNASVDGDYVVTPLMIEGNDGVHFIGSQG